MLRVLRRPHDKKLLRITGGNFGVVLCFVILLSLNGFAQSSTVVVTPTGLAISDRGGLSLTTDGVGKIISVGYARIQGTTATPAGVAIIGFQVNGTLVSEVGVPASPLLLNGRIYAEVAGPINTGLAIANPNSQAATVSFSFTDSAGNDFGAGATVIPANGQISKFLDQSPFNGGTNIHGAFSFSSNVPVSVIALRGFINERNEFLMSTLPVIDTSPAAPTTAVTLPHFADGGGWTTQIVLVNPIDLDISGSIRLVDPTGQTLNTFPFSIPRRSSFKLLTTGAGPSANSGSVQIVPNFGNAAPAAPVAIFSYKPAGITVSEAAIASVSGAALRMYVQAAGTPGATGAQQSGVALANLSSTSATVTFELSSLAGSPLASTSLIIPGNGQTSKFLNDIFGSQTPKPPLQGILRISTSGPELSVVGLRGRYNERGDFVITTTPPANEAATASSFGYAFPEVVNGGGYTTQFLLFSGAASQAGDASLQVVNQDGTPVNLPVFPVCEGATGTTPMIFRRVNPQYTDAARLARITGTVRMQGIVHEDGTLTIARFLQTLGYGLDENAQAALEQWRFCPAILSGQPVAASLTIEVNFNLR
jgi:TonB family protein